MPLSIKVESGEFPLPARTYIADRLLPVYRRFFAKEMKASRIVFVDSWEEDGCHLVKVVTSPDVSEWLPQRYASYVRYYTDSIEYHDVVRYDAAALSSSPYTFHVKIKPAFTDYVRTSSTLTIYEEDGGRRCRQVLEAEICCSIVGIGGYVEAYLRDSLVRIYERYGEVVAKWVQHREALLADPSAHPELLLDREFVDLVAPSISWDSSEEAVQGKDAGTSTVASITVRRTTAAAETEEQPHPLSEDPNAALPGLDKAVAAETAEQLADLALDAQAGGVGMGKVTAC